MAVRPLGDPWQTPKPPAHLWDPVPEPPFLMVRPPPPPHAPNIAHLDGTPANHLKGLFAWATFRLGQSWRTWVRQATIQRYRSALVHAQRGVLNAAAARGYLLHWQLVASDRAWHALAVGTLRLRRQKDHCNLIVQQWRDEASELKSEQAWQTYKFEHWQRPVVQQGIVSLLAPLRMHVSRVFAAWADVARSVRTRFSLHSYMNGLQRGWRPWRFAATAGRERRQQVEAADQNAREQADLARAARLREQQVKQLLVNHMRDKAQQDLIAQQEVVAAEMEAANAAERREAQKAAHRAQQQADEHLQHSNRPTVTNDNIPPREQW